MRSIVVVGMLLTIMWAIILLIEYVITGSREHLIARGTTVFAAYVAAMILVIHLETLINPIKAALIAWIVAAVLIKCGWRMFVKGK